MNKTQIFTFDALLYELDYEVQTFDCRLKNPDVCGNNSLIYVCAFAADDYLCCDQFRATKRQYEIL